MRRAVIRLIWRGAAGHSTLRSSVKLACQLADKEIQPSVVLDEQVELLSLAGDVALKDSNPQVHAHLIIGKSDGTAHGGHLIEAHVRPTGKVILTESRSTCRSMSIRNRD
jgi:predicted DNA-binding protein with PD1-like motif